MRNLDSRHRHGQKSLILLVLKCGIFTLSLLPVLQFLQNSQFEKFHPLSSQLPNIDSHSMEIYVSKVMADQRFRHTIFMERPPEILFSDSDNQVDFL